MTKHAQQVDRATAPQGAGAPVEIASQDPELIALGQLTLFPRSAIAEMARDLGRSLDCYVPTTECEAAVARFVSALKGHGWRFYRPASDLQN